MLVRQAVWEDEGEGGRGRRAKEEVELEREAERKTQVSPLRTKAVSKCGHQDLRTIRTKLYLRSLLRKKVKTAIEPNANAQKMPA